MTRFRVKHMNIKNTTLNIMKNKPWFTQKIAAELGEYFCTRVPTCTCQILVTTPSYQVNSRT